MESNANARCIKSDNTSCEIARKVGSTLETEIENVMQRSDDDDHRHEEKRCYKLIFQDQKFSFTELWF